MENAVLIIFFVLIFTILLLGSTSLHWNQRLLFLFSGIILCILFLVNNFFVVIPFEDLNFLWIVSLLLVSQIIALPILHWRAGKLLAKANDLYQADKQGVVKASMLLLFFLYFGLIPSHVFCSGVNGCAPNTSEFFLGRIPLWVSFILLIVYLLMFMFSRVGLREKGIVRFNSFIGWDEVLSYSWYEIDGQLRLRLEIRRFWISKVPSVIFLISQQEKQFLVDWLLNKPNEAVY